MLSPSSGKILSHGLFGDDGTISLNDPPWPDDAGIDTIPTDGFELAVASIVPATPDESVTTSGQSIAVTASAASGFVIIANYDNSLSGLATSSPALYAEVTGAITAAIDYYESIITTAMTITLDFGYGEIDGETMAANALGESSSNYVRVSYTQLTAALASHATSAADQAAVASLVASDPTGRGTWEISYAEAKALGLYTGTGEVDGYIGLSSTGSFTYDPNDRAVSGEYDAIATLEHEISEDIRYRSTRR